jgi:hypothetical protein
MMYGKIKVGEKDLTFCACASVNVCFFNVFHEDFIKMLSSDEGLATKAMMEMSFIMAKFGELNDRKKVNRLTEDDFCDWLDQFTTGELIDALPAIQEFYMTSNVSSVVAKKNNEELNEK